MPSARTLTVHNGVDIKTLEKQKKIETRKILGLKRDDILIATTASLTEKKCISTTIKAVTKLRTKGLKVWFIVIGEGPERDRLQQLITLSRYEKYIRLIGERNDIFGLLKGEVDIAVSSAKEESFGLSIAEASLARIPVISTRTTGSITLIDAEETGIILKDDSTQSLVNALFRLLNSTKLRKVMGEKGRLKITNDFGIDKVVNSFENLYRTILLDTKIKNTIPKNKSYLVTTKSITNFIKRKIRTYGV